MKREPLTVTTQVQTVQDEVAARRLRLVRIWFTPKSNELIPKFWLWIGLILMAIFVLAPFAYLFISSVSTTPQLLSGRLVPAHPTLYNYVHLLTGNGAGDYLASMRNSIVVSVTTTLVSMIIGTLAAYAFARFRFPFRMSMLFGILAMQILPSISIIIPLYIMMRNGISIPLPFSHMFLVHTGSLLDSVWALIIAYTSFSIPMVVWLLSGYFQTIPRELEESAFVDGCGRWRAMFQVVLPLSIPGLAATSIFTLLNAWDEFVIANAFTETYASKTLPIAIAEFIGKHGMDWGLMTAGGFIGSLPPVIIAMFLYRYIINGLTAGGVKG